MTTDDVCDLVLVFHLERLERHYLTERQIISAALMRGGKGEMPVWEQVRAGWLSELCTEPVRVSDRERRLRTLLGVA